MKKLSGIKKLIAVLCLVLVGVMCIGFTACGGDGDSDGDSNTYTFSAAYTDVTDLIGIGFSGGGGGKGCLAVDVGGVLRSVNGFFLDCLYMEGSTIIFEITSDRDVTDAKIVARLTADSAVGTDSLTINDEIYKITVNDVALEYGSITFNNILSNDGRPFTDHTVGTKVSLIEGKNIIKLITNNDMALGGTTEATAPRVDCIKITTAAVLTWEPVMSNVADF